MAKSKTKLVAINTLSQLAGRGVVIAISILTTALLRRYLGRDDYGIYIYVLNYVLLFAALADMGTHLTAVRETAISGDKKPKTLGVVVGLRLLLSAVASLIAVGLMSWVSFPSSALDLKLVVVGLLLGLVLKETIVVLYHCYEQLYWASTVQVITTLVQFIPVVVVLLTHGSVTSYFVVLTASMGILVVLWVLGLYFYRYFVWSWNWMRMKQLFIQAAPLGAILLLFTLYSKIDTLMIHHFYGAGAVGSYGLAYKVYENLVLPAAFLLNALLPSLSRLSVGPVKSLRIIWQRTFWLLFITAFVVAGVTLILAPWIIQILTGETGTQELNILRILAVAMIFAYLNHLTGYTLIAFNKQVIAFWGSLAGFGLQCYC